MTISYDPRAMEDKRQRAAELATRPPVKVRKGLHPTDYCALVALVSIAAALAAAVATGV